MPSCLLIVALLSMPAAAEPPPPKGYHLVAEDNCGTRDQAHVVVGKAWLYPPRGRQWNVMLTALFCASRSLGGAELTVTQPSTGKSFAGFSSTFGSGSLA